MARIVLTTDEVLRYTEEGRSRSTVRQHYTKWRREQMPSLPDRCDEEKCQFYLNPLVWCDKEFALILDHKDGCNTNNSPKNLRLLCPMCNSQLPTNGGGNRGRIEKSSGGFSIKEKTGLKHAYLPAEAGKMDLHGEEVEVILTKRNEPDPEESRAILDHIAALPLKSDDGFSGADHDDILYPKAEQQTSPKATDL